MEKKYDLIIVGGGPGGATCASFVGSTGKKVVLLDKAHFPRDKTCGDALSERALKVLDQLGLSAPLSRTEHIQVKGALLGFPLDRLISISSPKKEFCGAVCKRYILDTLLFSHAKKHCEVKEGFKVTDLLFDKERVMGVKGVCAEGREHELFAKVVVGADGANSLVARKLGVTLMDPKHNAVAIRGYYKNVPTTEHHIELHFLEELLPGYFWIFPTGGESQEVNVGMGLLSHYVRNREYKMKERLEEIIREHPLFASRFKEAMPEGQVMGWSLPMGSKQRKLVFPGALLLGDAAGLVNPLTGEGIGFSMSSGKLAADFLTPLLEKEEVTYQLLKGYQARMRKEFYFDHKFSYLLQKIFTSKKTLNFFSHLLKHSKYMRENIFYNLVLSS